MFFEFSKKRILILLGIILIVFVGVGASLVTNKNFAISKRVKVTFLKSKADIYYVWQKLRLEIEEGNIAFASDASSSINMIASSIFGGDVYYKSKYLGNSLPARSVPVIVYHGLPTEGGGSVPFKNFMSHMFALKRDGWETVTLEQFELYLRGMEDLPDKSFLLTFDDGRKDSFYPVDPVLRDMNYTGVMYVITGQSLRPDETVESTYYLSKIELDRMLGSDRWELGSHTRKGHEQYIVSEDQKHGNFLSNKFWLAEEMREETEGEFKERIETDLRGARADLEDTFGIKVDTFAFPFGDFGEQTINFLESKEIIEDVARSYYNLVFYQPDPSKGDTFNYPDEESFMIKRIEPQPDWSAEKLLEVINSGRAKELPYSSDFFGIDWHGNWGKITHGEKLSLKANENTSGSATSLNGSYLWKDYSFKANIDWLSGSDVLVIARYKNNDNYFACDFSKNSVNLKERVGGISRTIAFAPNYIVTPQNEISLGIRVEGNVVSCFMGDEEIISSEMTTELTNGGVAIHTWDPGLNRSQIFVNSVSVEEL